MDKNEIINFTQRKMEQYGLGKINVTFNHRISCIGMLDSYVSHSKKTIVGYEGIIFNNSILHIEEEEQEQIILHELVHYYNACKYGYDSLFEGDRGHGELFRKTCKKLGCRLNTSKYIGSAIVGKHYLKCKSCGKVCYTSNRTNKIIKNYNKCKCGYCKGELEYNQNY